MSPTTIFSFSLLVSLVMQPWAVGQSLPGYANTPLPPGYQRNTQPLSPYLNLLRGGNPAVNYFYGVRPGLNNPNQNALGVGAPVTGPRLTFFPRVDLPETEFNEEPNAGIPMTGHPIGFNNLSGYYGAANLNPNANNPANSRPTRRPPGRFGNR